MCQTPLTVNKKFFEEISKNLLQRKIQEMQEKHLQEALEKIMGK